MTHQKRLMAVHAPFSCNKDIHPQAPSQELSKLWVYLLMIWFFYVSIVKASVPPSNKKSITVWSQKGTEHQGAIQFRAICSHSLFLLLVTREKPPPINLFPLWLFQTSPAYLASWLPKLHYEPPMPVGFSSSLSTPSHWSILLNTPVCPFIQLLFPFVFIQISRHTCC